MMVGCQLQAPSVYLRGEVSNHFGKGLEQLLWAGSRAARVKLQQVVYITS